MRIQIPLTPRMQRALDDLRSAAVGLAHSQDAVGLGQSRDAVGLGQSQDDAPAVGLAHSQADQPAASSGNMEKEKAGGAPFPGSPDRP